MTWRCDAPDQAHAFDTREQADAKRAELLAEKPNRAVVVWEMADGDGDGPEPLRIDPLAAWEPFVGEPPAHRAGKLRVWRRTA